MGLLVYILNYILYSAFQNLTKIICFHCTYSVSLFHTIYGGTAYSVFNSGRMYLVVVILPYILPIILGFVILYGAKMILSFPFDMVAKSKRKKLLETEEGNKILLDFAIADHYFDDKIRIGKVNFYKSQDNFYSFEKIELFKLEKQDKKISLLYR